MGEALLGVKFNYHQCCGTTRRCAQASARFDSMCFDGMLADIQDASDFLRLKVSRDKPQYFPLTLRQSLNARNFLIQLWGHHNVLSVRFCISFGVTIDTN
ncbi:hypothetical protein PQU92_09420 [Asticcacaulis sp. BYS171W]|uniref:Uncharacterized protein n=1 Tax=Asticcacaulis aquaticus TaxID=2984212 RepID=A0ABT5HTX2_9CAUL|nr:hypothetical protein [Asticcacaulis aquaticus]MDC7683494.1 hypothetical protein [Asticcacaulis aquaticus]